MATVTHQKVSAIADDSTAAAAGSVVPSDWNATHSVALVDADIPATLLRNPIGTGDAVQMYNATTSQLLGVRKGTAAAPDTVGASLLKVERTTAVTDATLIGKGAAGELMSAIVGITTGTIDQTAQTVGVSGLARNVSTSAGTEGRLADALGLSGVGRITGAGIGTGIGAALYGRRDTTTGRATGIEVGPQNYTATAGSYSSIGYSDSIGIWLVAIGDSDAGVGLQVGNPLGRQFKVGIGFNGQYNGGKIGGVVDSTIRDDSTSITSLDIRGTHAGYGLDLGLGTYTLGAIRIPNNVPVRARNAANTADHNVLNYSSTDFLILGQDAVAIYIPDKNLSLGSATGTKLGTTTTQKLGFWSATPVVRPTGWAAATGVATRTTFDTTTVTLPLLAERVKALIDNLMTIGLIGA